MRILIYGADVMGSIFAGKLFSSGNDVTILAENKRFEELKSNGLIMREMNKKKIEKYPIKVIDKLESDDIYDYILVTMQFIQVKEILPILANNGSENIILCVNNPCGYDKWKEYIGERLMIGCHACGGEITNNIMEYYICKGVARGFQTTTFGEIDGTRTDRLNAIVKIVSKSGIPSVISDNIDAWQKCHIAIVCPIANVIYKNNGDIKALAKNKADIQLMIKATREGLSALKELGYKIEPRKISFYYMPMLLLTFIFGILLKSKTADLGLAKDANDSKEEMAELQKLFELLIKDSGTFKENIYLLSKYLDFTNVTKQFT